MLRVVSCDFVLGFSTQPDKTIHEITRNKTKNSACQSLLPRHRDLGRLAADLSAPVALRETSRCRQESPCAGGIGAPNPTGRYLKQALPELKVPTVLTGAMTPLGFEGSYGLQNLTESLFAVRIPGPGIYVVMHNQAFPIDRVRKERETSRFVWID